MNEYYTINYNLIKVNELLKVLKFKKQYARDLKKKMMLLTSIKMRNYKELNRFLNFSNYYLNDSSPLEFNNFSIAYIIDFSFTKSNTFLHVMDFSGNLKFYYSAGLLKYKGKKKRAKASILKDFYNIILVKLRFLKGKPVVLHFKNVGTYYRKIFKQLKKKFFVTYVTFFYVYPHNGCRKKKIWRWKVRTKKRRAVWRKKEMAEWFKATDCKSVEFSHRRFKSCFLYFNDEIWRSGSVSALGAESHVFKSHYFEKFVIK